VTGPVRALRSAVLDAVRAAAAADGPALADCGPALASLDEQRLRIVLGEMLRTALEELHPDGLSGADAQDLIEHCTEQAGWYPELDPQVLVVVLLGAFGAHDPDQQPALPPATVAQHAAVLLVDLLAGTDETKAGETKAGETTAGETTAGRTERLLNRALAELERAETMEMP
jgi:hypothetical protein